MRLLGLVFTVFVVSLASCSPDSGTMVIDFKTREGTSLAFDVSPDGASLVLDLLGQLWVIPREGGAAVAITDAVRDTSEDIDPVISPDGQTLVFSSDRPGGVGLFEVPIEGGAARRLTTGEPYQPHWKAAWSPTGDRIAFVSIGGSQGLYVLDYPDGTPDQLTVEGLPNGAVTDPTWSPDGSRILFVNVIPQRREGGALWSVPADGGTAVREVGVEMDIRAPAYSPDGERVAFAAQDPDGAFQLWVAGPGDEPRRLTSHADMNWRRIRWLPDGTGLAYHADGLLWTVPVVGGPPEGIPFSAHVRFHREIPPLPPATFPTPGSRVTARGFSGLGISPDGERVAIIALGRLWLLGPGDAVREIAEVPATAGELSWSPDKSEIVWAAGPAGSEDLYSTSLATGEIRRRTALDGSETRPSWSPTGEQIAFHHESSGDRRVRVMEAHGSLVEELSDAPHVGPGFLRYGLSMCPTNPIMWSPDLLPTVMYTTCDGLVVVGLGGEVRILAYPDEEWPNFMAWTAPDEVTFVWEDRLWRSSFDASREGILAPEPVADDPALYVTVGRDGSALYVSSDGLRIRRPSGRVERLGWPLSYSTPVPPDVVIRNAQLIGRELGDDAPVDIFVRAGRIDRIVPTGQVSSVEGTAEIDAENRFVMPGLIDLHQHTANDARPLGALLAGVTTVRDAGSNRGIAWLAAWRDGAEAGLWPGPRIVIGGIQHSGLGRYSGLGQQRVTGPETQQRAVALQRAFGSAYLKQRIFFDWSATSQLVRDSHEAGLRTSGHIGSPLPLVAAGMDGKEHLGGSGGDRMDGIPYDDVIQLYRAADMWVVSTIVFFSNVPRTLDRPEILNAPEIMALSRPPGTPLRLPRAAVREGNERLAGLARAAAFKLHRGGVTLAAGTDRLPWSIHWELEDLVDAGLPPIEAIRVATENAADVLGASEEIGRVAEGFWADLVILEQDPRENIRNTWSIWKVFKGGVEVDREALLLWPAVPEG